MVKLTLLNWKGTKKKELLLFWQNLRMIISTRQKHQNYAKSKLTKTWLKYLTNYWWSYINTYSAFSRSENSSSGNSVLLSVKVHSLKIPDFQYLLNMWLQIHVLFILKNQNQYRFLQSLKQLFKNDTHNFEILWSNYLFISKKKKKMSK